MVLTPTPAGAEPLLVASGGNVLLRVTGDDLLGIVSAESSDPSVLSVEQVGQELGSEVAFLTLKGRAVETATLTVRVDGEVLAVVPVEVRAGAKVVFVAPSDGVDAEARFDGDLSFDTRSHVGLAAEVEDANGAVLLGSGVVDVVASEKGKEVPGAVSEDENHDVFTLDAAKDGKYALDVKVNDTKVRTLTYHAVGALEATDADWIGDKEKMLHPAPGATLCVGVAPTIDTERVYAAQATWTLDGVAMEKGASGAYVCYTYSPGEKKKLTAKYGSTLLETDVNAATILLLQDYAGPASVPSLGRQ